MGNYFLEFQIIICDTFYTQWSTQPRFTFTTKYDLWDLHKDWNYDVVFIACLPSKRGRKQNSRKLSWLWCQKKICEKSPVRIIKRDISKEHSILCTAFQNVKLILAFDVEMWYIFPITAVTRSVICRSECSLTYRNTPRRYQGHYTGKKNDFSPDSNFLICITAAVCDS